MLSNGNPQRLTTHPPLKRASLRYPVPPAKINLETLRGITHMRPRTTVIGAVMRIRNSLAYATHTFFQTAGFMYVHAPLITGADCEGAGEMFQVTTMDVGNVPKAGGAVDYTQVCASLSLRPSLRPSLLPSFSYSSSHTHTSHFPSSDLNSISTRLASAHIPRRTSLASPRTSLCPGSSTASTSHVLLVRSIHLGRPSVPRTRTRLVTSPSSG